MAWKATVTLPSGQAEEFVLSRATSAAEARTHLRMALFRRRETPCLYTDEELDQHFGIKLEEVAGKVVNNTSSVVRIRSYETKPFSPFQPDLPGIEPRLEWAGQLL